MKNSLKNYLVAIAISLMVVTPAQAKWGVRHLLLGAGIAGGVALKSASAIPKPVDRTTTLVNETVTGKVTLVDDGDTIKLQVPGRGQFKVRLANIDAPEISHANAGGKPVPDQPFGKASFQSLEKMIANQQVQAVCGSPDAKYGRSVCTLFTGSTNVNAEQVKSGMAWAIDGKFLTDPQIKLLEVQARNAKIGLWQDSKPIKPSLWRKVL